MGLLQFNNAIQSRSMRDFLYLLFSEPLWQTILGCCHFKT